MPFFVYIMANRRHGALYTGMTDDLARRVWQHREGAVPGFTSRYGIKALVWFEPHGSRESAFTRERRIKAWKRRWKVELVEAENPGWEDLYCRLLG